MSRWSDAGFHRPIIKAWNDTAFRLDDIYPKVPTYYWNPVRLKFESTFFNETPCGTHYKGVWYPPISFRTIEYHEI